MSNANIQCQCSMSMLNANMGQKMGCMWLDRLHRGCIWLPMGSIWQLRGYFWVPWGCPWLLRGSIWLPMVLHMAAEGLHMAAHGDLYGCSEAAFGCRCVAFCCTGAVYGSHAADMQHMLHLAGPGLAARILRPCLLYTSPSPRDQRGSRMPSSA